MSIDNRYSDGYSTEFSEWPWGAYMTVRHNGRIIAECGVGFVGGRGSLPQLCAMRFVPNALGPTMTIDDWKAA